VVFSSEVSENVDVNSDSLQLSDHSTPNGQNLQGENLQMDTQPHADELKIDEQKVEEQIAEALACPCVEDLRAGPCGKSFELAFSCFLRRQALHKVLPLTSSAYHCPVQARTCWLFCRHSAACPHLLALHHSSEASSIPSTIMLDAF
jgi:hypothetical protein